MPELSLNKKLSVFWVERTSERERKSEKASGRRGICDEVKKRGRITD